MSAVSSLPVEIWEAILRCAIAVPDFLDADLAEDALVETLYKDVSSPMADESTYWSAERVRNRLQRVSKPWDAYLRRFEHRYVRLLDIRYGKVDPNKLIKAIRISFGRCDRVCTDARHSPTDVSLADFCLQTLLKIDNLDAEIIDMQCEISPVLHPGSYPKLAQVKTLFAHMSGHYLPLVQLIGALPNLCRAYTGRSLCRPRKDGLTPHLSSPSLLTLTVRICLTSRYNMLTVELPSLRHLSIKPFKHWLRQSSGDASTFPILQAVGGQLHSLHLHYQTDPNNTLGEIWELCPKLKVFYTGFPLTSAPPPFHPIHTLVVNHRNQLEELNPLLKWSNLRRVIVLNPAGFAEHDDWGTLSVASREGVRLENGDGFTLEELEEKRVRQTPHELLFEAWDGVDGK